MGRPPWGGTCSILRLWYISGNVPILTYGAHLPLNVIFFFKEEKNDIYNFSFCQCWQLSLWHSSLSRLCIQFEGCLHIF